MDVSNLKINNVNYAIKDSVARQNYATLSTTVGENSTNITSLQETVSGLGSGWDITYADDTISFTAKG